MTPGPEPMRRAEAGLLTRLASRRPERGDKAVEHCEGIERSRRALGVVLHGLDRELGMAEPFDRAVVQVDLADAEATALRQRLAHHLHLVVLRRDLHVARIEVAHWVVRAVVAEAQSLRFGARGPRHDLVAETDAEQRSLRLHDGLGERRWTSEP